MDELVLPFAWSEPNLAGTLAFALVYFYLPVSSNKLGETNKEAGDFLVVVVVTCCCDYDEAGCGF